MNNKLTAIILGGTFPHIELAQNLRSRGYYTILIDYFETPPAKEYVDEHILESTLDKEKVLKIAIEKKTNLVITTCIDQANVTACYVAEKLNLPMPYSYKTAINVTNKILMKTLMREGGIPTSKFYEIREVKDLEKYKDNLSYPMIVKPTDSNSSKGVKKVDNYEELTKFTKIALEISRVNQAIIEDFVYGKEIAVDCIIKDSKATVVMSRERINIKNSDIDNQQIYGSFWPAELSDELIEKYRIVADKIAKQFELSNTPLMIQTILGSDGSINVIEFAPRIGGGENYKVIKTLTGFDIINEAINSFLSHPIELNHNKPEEIIFDNYLYAESDSFGRVTGVDSLVEDQTVEYYNIYKEKGTKIDSGLSSNNRIGVLTIKDTNRDRIMRKLKKSIKKIDIISIDGKSIMLKNIYEDFI